MLREFADIFSDVPSKTTYISHTIKLKTNEPVYCKPYKVPVHLVSKVDKELQLMLRQGIIEPSDSNYASPMVVINKKGSDAIWICVDYTSGK